MTADLRLAVIGGGWAGISAAVQGVQSGADVTLFEMAPQLGGRARSVASGSDEIDNGQHILIGAYQQTLTLMRSLGLDPASLLHRTPLNLRYADREGLELSEGHPLPSFAKAVLKHKHWSWRSRLSLLNHSAIWALHGFKAPAATSVANLCERMPDEVRRDLIWPLCVAALNTPAEEASAQVFLRVLQDAVFGGRGASDLLIPRVGLSELLARPASAWLAARGAHIRLQTRVHSLHADEQGWRVDNTPFDAVVLACSSVEAARLTELVNPDWSALAQTLCFEPIITVYLQSIGSALPAPMLALHDGPDDPAQFVFDLGQIDTRRQGLFSLVVSGAARWNALGLDACGKACLAQAQRQLTWASTPTLIRALAEKRATFACSPALVRPGPTISTGLWAAGDYIAGPYPATLEGAVRSGFAAAQGALHDAQSHKSHRPVPASHQQH